jgi:PAS domain S-box-containing protein
MAHALSRAGDCITVTGTSDRPIYVNDALLRAYGYTEMELLGQPADTFRSKRNPPSVSDEARADTYAGGWRGQLWNRAEGGPEFPIALTTSAVRNGHGDVVAAWRRCARHFGPDSSGTVAARVWTREEMMGCPATNYVAPEFHRQQLGILDLVRAGAIPAFNENAILTKNGERR